MANGVRKGARGAAWLIAVAMGAGLGGCSYNPWATFPDRPLEKPPAASSGKPAEQAPPAPPPVVKRRDLDWKRIMEWIASGDVAHQRAIVAKLEQKLEAEPSPDLRLKLAFMLGFSEGRVRDPARALTLYKQIDQPQREALRRKTLPALASVMLERLQADRGKIWWLKKDVERLSADLKKSQAQVQTLEEKLRAITSIEESIHQRNR